MTAAMRRTALLAALATAIGLAGAPPLAEADSGPTALGYRAPRSAIEPAAEDTILALLNQLRRELHAPPLAMDPLLRSAARAHSLDMALRGYFGHASPQGQSFVDRLAAIEPPGTLVGENVAFADSPQSAHAEFLASPGHFRVMTNPAFRRVGIGVATAGDLGIAVTEDFAQ